MPLLTVGGVGVEVLEFTEQTPERIGDRGRGFDGALWSQVRAEKRTWSATTSYLTLTELSAIRSAVALDTPVTVTNTVDSVAITAMVRVEDVTDWQASSAGLLRRARIVAVEV